MALRRILGRCRKNARAPGDQQDGQESDKRRRARETTAGASPASAPSKHRDSQYRRVHAVVSSSRKRAHIHEFCASRSWSERAHMLAFLRFSELVRTSIGAFFFSTTSSPAFLPPFLKMEAKLLAPTSLPSSDPDPRLACEKVESIDMLLVRSKECVRDGRSEPMAPCADVREEPMLGRPERLPLPLRPLSEHSSSEDTERSPCAETGDMLPERLPS